MTLRGSAVERGECGTDNSKCLKSVKIASVDLLVLKSNEGFLLRCSS